LGDFAVVPLVVGNASAEEVAEVLDILWGGPETLILISSDLSHYLPYAQAQALDAATCRAIEALDPEAIGETQACGRVPVRGLLALARRKNMQVSTVDLRNSGDTAGSKDRVVGYGAWVFVEPEAATKGSADFAAKTHRLLAEHGGTLLRTAAASILHGLDHGSPLMPALAGLAPDLTAPGACFVTLKRGLDLRGCIGSPTAHRPLIVDAAENGFAAAFRDPRFPKLTAAEIPGLSLSISVLSPPQPMKVRDEADLLGQLRPGVDGLIIVDGERRGLFLPAVWKSLPDPRAFLSQLKLKAGMTAAHWSPTFTASRFIAAEVSSEALADPQSIWTSTPIH
jgi:AmmeMemoRadiSam system protein A